MAEDTEDKEELSMEDILSSIKDILMGRQRRTAQGCPERRACSSGRSAAARSRGFPAGRLPKPSMTF